MPTLQVNGQTMYYELLGDGPQTALLMHGWIQVGRDMRELGEALAGDGYRVILPDLPGYGQSVPPFRSYPPDFYRRDAALMAEFLDALNQRRVDVLGFSDGGEVALLLPLLRPDLCRTVVAWGALGAFGPEACEQVRRGLPPDWITEDIRARHPGQDVDMWPYAWVEAFCAMIAAGGDLSLGRAAEIQCPVLLMLGAEDRLNPPAAGQRFIAASARHGVPRLFRVFPNAGHAIHEQQPQAFLDAVRQFMQLARLNAAP